MRLMREFGDEIQDDGCFVPIGEIRGGKLFGGCGLEAGAGLSRCVG